MAKPFLLLSAKDRYEALQTAAAQTGRSAYLLEKDVWVVWTLGALFSAPFGNHLVFKGGTSLSKAYGLINRFSEDIDLTYDIRQLIPDLIEDANNPMPASRAQSKKWVAAVEARLPAWIAAEVLPALEQQIARQKVPTRLTIEKDKVHVVYDVVTEGRGYVKPEVLLEFGARSTGEPADHRDVVCDAAGALTTLDFPVASPRVMLAERTFWEKATAAHVFCKKGEFRGERFARHWYDLVRLHAGGVADRAIGNAALARSVAEHKAMFFRENDADGPIDYVAAVTGGLQLVPAAEAFEGLSADYAAMTVEGLFLEDPESFEDMMEQCRAIEALANVPR